MGLAGWVLLLVVAIVALLAFGSESNVGAIALALLLPPLVATGSGPYPAAVAALVSGLAFNVGVARRARRGCRRAARPGTGAGFTPEDLAWILTRAPFETLVLRPGNGRA